MSNHVVMWALGAATLCLAGLTYLAGHSNAAENKEIAAAVRKIAAALKEGDKDAAHKAAGALAKKLEDTEEVMDLFKPQNKGGLGIGAKLLALNRAALAPAALKKDAEALEEMGYIVAAVAEVAHHRAPESDKGKKTRKDWIALSADMKSGGLKLAEAAKAKNPQDVKSAAGKLDTSCNTCHSIFR